MPESPFSISPALLSFIGGVVSGLIPTYINLYRNWKKSGKEEAKIEAETHHTKESTLSLRLRDNLATADQVGRMLDSLMGTGDKLGALQEKMFDQAFEMDQLKTRLKLAQHFNKRAKALLDFHEISFSEADRIILLSEREREDTSG